LIPRARRVDQHFGAAASDLRQEVVEVIERHRLRQLPLAQLEIVVLVNVHRLVLHGLGRIEAPLNLLPDAARKLVFVRRARGALHSISVFVLEHEGIVEVRDVDGNNPGIFSTAPAPAEVITPKLRLRDER
jgi:hypothetical protein